MRICLIFQSQTISSELLAVLDSIMFGGNGTEDGRHKKLAEHTSNIFARAVLGSSLKICVECF